MVWNKTHYGEKIATDEAFKKAGYLTSGEIDEMIAKRKAQESTDRMMIYMTMIQEQLKLTNQ